MKNIILVILVIAVISLLNQVSDLERQVQDYQKQSTEYEGCVSSYKDREQKLKSAIESAYNDLSFSGQSNYRMAQDELSNNLYTFNVDCNISTVGP